MYDLIVTGGGSSGVAAAVSASNNGCSTLLIEKMGFLGGASTASLVTPMMRNMISPNENLTEGLYSEVLSRLSLSGDAATHEDGNPGWFNPEVMKCVLDDICYESKVKTLFDTVVTNVDTEKNKITSIKCFNKSGFSSFSSKYFVDATGDADIAAMAGVSFSLGDSENLCLYELGCLNEKKHKHQAMSLRFIMSNVDIDLLADWLAEIDPDSGVFNISRSDNGQLLLTTAHTWEERDWKLRPYLEQAIKDRLIENEDAAYFQLFSIPGQKTSVGFNCPRIYSEKPLDTLDMWDLSYAQRMGRKQILRIAEFSKKYLKGFEDAYISQIAPALGVRDSRRIDGRYKLTEEDIFNAKKFADPIAKSNYPVDIHSQEKGKSELKSLSEHDYYEIPAESLIPKEINNLLVVGRSVSATFKAQASLRIQPNCWAMGETAGKIISDKIKRAM